MGNAVKLAIRRGERRGAFGLTVTQMPEDTPTDNRGQVDPLGEAAAVFLIGEDIPRQWQPTPGQHGDHTVLPKGADHTLEGHG